MNQHLPVFVPQIVLRLGPHQAGKLQSVVAVPAHNEVERLPNCLAALSAQEDIAHAATGVVLLLNNCTDGTLDAVRAMGPSLRVPTWAVVIDLPPPFANAGWARRAAMEYAATLVSRSGNILTTDADTIPDPDWISRIEAAFAQGADAVAGYVTADPEELGRLPEAVLERGALEWEYQNLAVEVESRADPQPHDEWPRHNQNCGANAAITAAFYRSIGGLPPEPVGEDRAMFNEVRLRDGKIRHSLEAHVITSARTEGRAFGGMADALRLRDDPEYPCDDILETAARTLRRNRLRAKARQDWGRSGSNLSPVLLRALGLPEGLPDDVAGEARFGVVWSMIEAASPVLQNAPLTSRNMHIELVRMRRLVERLRHRLPT